MANVHRLRGADKYQERLYAVDSAQVIEVGDLVWLNTDDIRPASAFTYASTLLITQTSFRDQFAGVAMTASASGETAAVTVYGAGIYEFNCASATFEIDDLIGVDDNASANALLDDQVIAVSSEPPAIGRVAKRYAANTTRVVVKIMPYNRRIDAV